MRRRLLLAPALAAALGLAACGGGGSGSGATGTQSGGAGASGGAPIPNHPAAKPLGPPAAAAAPRRSKPTVPRQHGPAPKRLVVKDLIRGTGPVARQGDVITVHYVGVDRKTGRQFDASWDRGQPFTFQLGGGQVIPGWDEGVPGMRVGGRRELIIPPALGYGPQGQPPTIRPNETLVFVIDLLRVGR